MDERLTAKELDRLADWLTAQGLTPEKVLECIKYIADEAPRRRGKRKPLTLQQINERQGFSQTAGGFPASHRIFILLGRLRLGLFRVYYTVENRKNNHSKHFLFTARAYRAGGSEKKRIEKSSQAIILTGISGSGNVIRTHDTSGMNRMLWPAELCRHMVAGVGFEPTTFGL